MRFATAWVAWARRHSVRRLEVEVERAGQLALEDPARFEATGGLPAAGDSDGWQTCAEPRAGGGAAGARTGPSGAAHEVAQLLSAPAEVMALFLAALCTIRREVERRTGRLPSEDEAFYEMLVEAWNAGGGDARLPRRHATSVRHGFCCAVPGCSSARLQEHHVVYRSRGGGNEPENRVALCPFHHLRGEHGGTLRIRGRAPDRLTFELGLVPGRPALATYRSGDVLVGGDASSSSSSVV